MKTLLEGSVRKAGNRVRITAQLVNSEDGFHLWSETYDRVLEDIFAVQDEIAGAVAAALNVTLLGARTAERAEDPKVLGLVMRAYQTAQQVSGSSISVARDLFQQALDRDPDNARAWAGLARVYMRGFGYGLMDAAEADANAHKALKRALELDPESDEVQSVLGYIRVHDFDWDGSLAAYRKAHALAPGNCQHLAQSALPGASHRTMDFWTRWGSTFETAGDGPQTAAADSRDHPPAKTESVRRITVDSIETTEPRTFSCGALLLCV